VEWICTLVTWITRVLSRWLTYYTRNTDSVFWEVVVIRVEVMLHLIFLVGCIVVREYIYSIMYPCSRTIRQITPRELSRPHAIDERGESP
jgi:hypothetical protein